MIVPPWPSRAVARSTRAMIATPHALATAAGREVLRRGGNAVDAAVAANAVLAVVYPASCGIGGDALWLVHDPRRTGPICYNGSGRTPREADPGALPGGVVPLRGALSVTVPGAVRSWEDVARAHGTRGLDELLADAETYARDGFAVTDVVARYFAINEALLRADPEATRVFFGDGVPRAGTILPNPDLARTLAAIRQGGADAFYTGATAGRIVRTLRARGNAMQEDDLASHVTEAAEPLRVAWRGFDVLAHPPNSQAGCLLLALGMLAADGDREPGLWTHLAVEAMKRALAIRDALICDPATHPSELPALLAPERLRAMRSRIDPERATDVPGACDRGDTVAICVVDENGMAVSLIESLFNGFGSGIVAEDTGVVLHNRGAYFAADPAALNAYAPGKRPLHTLSPAMVLRDGAPALVLGTMGGDGQPQILLQVLHAILERGLDVQTALDAPRWVYGRHAVAGRPDVLEHAHVLVEPAFDPAIVAALERRGHRVVAADAFGAFGHAHAIAIDRAAGTLAGGADPRADSAALGL